MDLNKLQQDLLGEINKVFGTIFSFHPEIKVQLTFTLYNCEDNFIFSYAYFSVDSKTLDQCLPLGKSIRNTISSLLEHEDFQQLLKIYAVLVGHDDFKITINYSHIIITHYV